MVLTPVPPNPMTMEGRIFFISGASWLLQLSPIKCWLPAEASMVYAIAALLRAERANLRRALASKHGYRRPPGWLLCTPRQLRSASNVSGLYNRG